VKDDDREPVLTIGRPAREWPTDRMDALRREVGACQDVAFAHLPEVIVEGHGHKGNRVLFVWLVPEAMPALRAALNTICDAVARALPRSEFIDVVILNSAPELLLPVEEAGCLLVENDANERDRALDAARSASGKASAAPEAHDPWWAFWRR